MLDLDLLEAYDYSLPPDLIAHVPCARRDAARLLTLDRDTGGIIHQRITDFPSLLRPGDVLVLNETRVIPARLRGVRTTTGGKWEGLFLSATSQNQWRIICQTRGKLRAGETISLFPPVDCRKTTLESLHLRLIEQDAEGEWLVELDADAAPLTLLDRFGGVPLPPYIQRDQPTAEDRERYQTVYARTPGAIAAPTAGLHFTNNLLSACRARGVDLAFVTLHVGLGTFRPVTAARLSEHKMHSEWCELPAETAAALHAARGRGGRVVCVGTTTVRTLETVAASGPIRSWSGETKLFIRPPYAFAVVDAMLTNFHLPRSTLMALVCAFAGRRLALQAYAEAVVQRYRFFSYGDAMFIS